jgi:hypothetical protein
MFQELLGSVLSGAGSSGDVTSQPVNMADRINKTFPVSNTPQMSVPVYVAPVGVNLGEIVKHTSQGGAENGGAGLGLSRYVGGQSKASPAVPAKLPGFDFNKSGKWILVAAIGGMLTYFIVFR